VEARGLVLAVTLFELALAAFTACALMRSSLAGYGGSGHRQPVVLVAFGSGLAGFVLVLTVVQWRVGPVARLRMLLVGFGSLVWCFCALAWHDIATAMACLPNEPIRAWGEEQNLAAGVSMAALLLGLAAVGVVLWLERRSLKA